jgi:hypothetical protein
MSSKKLTPGERGRKMRRAAFVANSCRSDDEYQKRWDLLPEWIKKYPASCHSKPHLMSNWYRGANLVEVVACAKKNASLWNGDWRDMVRQEIKARYTYSRYY